MKLGKTFVIVFFMGGVLLSLWFFLSAIQSIPDITQTVLLDVPELGEGREAKVTWPDKIRLDEPTRLRMEFIPQAGGSGISSDGQVALEARLELPGLILTPEGALITALNPGAPVLFEWTLMTDQPGSYPGTLWLYLNLVPRSGGATEQVALLAKPVEISTEEDGILSPQIRRVIGLAGVAIGLMIIIRVSLKS